MAISDRASDKELVRKNLHFPGQFFDEESGSNYNYQRFYDPENGRYTSADPIGLNGGINLFAYTKDDPVNSMDPEGQEGKPPSWEYKVPIPGHDPNISTGGRFLDQLEKAVRQTKWYFDMAAITQQYNQLAYSIPCNRKKWATFCYNPNGWTLSIDRFGSMHGPGTRCGSGFIIGKGNCQCVEGG